MEPTVMTINEEEALAPKLDKPTGRSASDLIRHVLSKYALVVVFVVVVAFFSVLNPSIFPTGANAQTIMGTNATIALLALAAMMPLIVGQFDISVGFQFGLAQALTAGLMVNQGLPAIAVIVIVVLVGLGLGFLNGMLVAKAKLSSFIVTLATGILVLGVTQWYTGDVTITGPMPGWFLTLGRGKFLGIPLPFVYVILATAVLWVALEYTSWGRHLYATGGNARAAVLAGVPVDRATVQAFMVTGLLCALAGAGSVSILGASSPVVGLGALLPAFAGAFLGATSIRPGRFNALGTVLAVYLVAVGITGLRQHGAQNYVEQVFYGLALLVAILLARYAGNGRKAS